MPVESRWWSDDPSERYWLEITTRTDIGTNLHAPKFDDRGKKYWSYAFVEEVRPGDLVLHWDKNHGPGIVGYSRVLGEAIDSTIVWASRGTSGRQQDASGAEAAWLAPLGGYRPLKHPVTQSLLHSYEPRIRSVHDDLKAVVGKRLYFPFVFSERRPIRAAQAYLTKFPRTLVEELSELSELRQIAVAEPHEAELPTPQSSPAPKQPKSSGYGRQRDAKRRQAVERHAMDLVLEHHRSLGYEVEDVGDHKPWDITVRRDGIEGHIEVKGSTVTREAIDLTEGEVRHAERGGIPTRLIVIDQIRLDEHLRCHGGRWRTWMDWTPKREELVATAYRYPLPEGEGQGPPAF